MRLIPYRHKDAEIIAGWPMDERSHAMWCANLLPYPLDAEKLNEAVLKLEKEREHTEFVALKDDGTVIGFFFMSFHLEEAYAYMGFVIIDETQRGKGYGRQMMRLAYRYAFTLTGMRRVRLRVYDHNEAAHRMYLKAGMRDINYNPRFYRFSGETWGTYQMEITRDEFLQQEATKFRAD